MLSAVGFYDAVNAEVGTDLEGRLVNFPSKNY
jgi:hypothetical protein